MARKGKDTEAKELNGSADLEMDQDHAEPRVYELGFHIDGELPEEEVKKVYQAVKDTVSANGTIITEGEAEKVQLAYTISRMEPTGRRDWDAAFFGWIAYEATGEGHEAIVHAASANPRIIRFLDLRTNKEAAKHSAEMHEFYRKLPEAPVAEEESTDAELDAALKEVGITAP